MKIKKYFIFINKIKYFVLELILKKMVNFYMNLHVDFYFIKLYIINFFFISYYNNIIQNLLQK